MVDIKNLEQMADEEWDREMEQFMRECNDDCDDGYEEYEPGRGHWDEMAANP